MLATRARRKTIQPATSRHTGQISLDLPNYLMRTIPEWSRPEWWLAERWRRVVLDQPVALLCKDTMTQNMLDLDWTIEPTVSTMRQELKGEIEHYTKFFMYTGDYDYTEIVEWVIGDLLDLPFGSAVEIGRENDTPDGRVVWLELLDGGTLFPSLNSDYPVGQKVPMVEKTVYFPAHAVNRVYLSPRTEIQRKGWGMAPPEKMYLAISLLARGDVYYANLLLDTPEAGILDLGDMEEVAATRWLESFRSLMSGIDPLKIPVLYEHTTPAKYIPFGRPPSEIMFDRITLKYAAIVAAAYGMSLSDIGLQVTSSSGETLAGTIRQERRTRRTGIARLKKKLAYFMNRMLPEYLFFKWIDLDDELSVALGRARLSTTTALGQAIRDRYITPLEARQIVIADGLVSVALPEDIPDDVEWSDGNAPERPGILGNSGVAPSLGGHGEISERSTFDQYIENLDLPGIVRRAIPRILAEKREHPDMNEDQIFALDAPQHFRNKSLTTEHGIDISGLLNRSLYYAVYSNVDPKLDDLDVLEDNDINTAILADLQSYIEQIRAELFVRSQNGNFNQ